MVNIGPIVDAANLLQRELPRLNYLLNYAEQFSRFQKTQEEMAQDFRGFMESIQLSLDAQRSQNEQILQQQREILARLSNLENVFQVRQSPDTLGSNSLGIIPDTAHARMQEYPSPRSMRMSTAPIHLDPPLTSAVMEGDYDEVEIYHYPETSALHAPNPLDDIETKLYPTPNCTSVTGSQTSHEIDFGSSGQSSSQITVPSSRVTFKPSSSSTLASRPRSRDVPSGNTSVTCFTEMQEESSEPRQVPVTRRLIQRSSIVRDSSPSSRVLAASGHPKPSPSSLSEPQRRVVECIQELTRNVPDGRGVHVNDIILTLKNNDCEWTADSLLDAFDVVENLGFIETLEEDVERYVAL